MNFKKIIVLALIGVSIGSVSAYAKSEAHATKNTTGTVTDDCDKSSHGNYKNGHYTRVVRSYSLGRTYGLAAVGNAAGDGMLKIAVNIDGSHYGSKTGNNYVQTSTYSEWGEEYVESVHS